MPRDSRSWQSVFSYYPRPYLLRYSRPLLQSSLLLALLVSIYAIFAKGGLVDLWRIRTARQGITAQVALLVRQNKELAEYVERLRHDDRLLEQLVREELGWIREGDLVYIFPESGAARGSRGRRQRTRDGALHPAWERK